MNGIQRYVLGWNDPKLPAAWVLPFNWHTFDPAEFQRQRIAMPPSIQRSVPKRQAEFFMGRVLAREALSDLGVVAHDLPIGPTREPQWPAGVAGSITHADRLAAAIAVPARDYLGVGLDMEHIVSAEVCESIQNSVLTPAERALMARPHAALSPEAWLTIVFSAKESFYKGAFGVVGRFFGFEAVTLVAFDVVAGVLEFELCETLAPSLVAGKRVALRAGFIDDATVITSFVWPASR